MSIQGADRHAARLKALRAGSKRLGALVYAAADEIRAEARLSITRGSVSGKGHRASLPGQPPNRDTGNLDTNIETTRTGELTCEVRSKSGHAVALEYGTSKMAERPYMRPAVAKVKPKMHEHIKAGVSRMVKES